MNRRSEVGEGLERIRRAMKTRRVALGINQKEAALRAGIAPGTLKRFERTGEISLERLLALMWIFGMDRRVVPAFEDMSWWELDEIRRAENRRKA